MRSGWGGSGKGGYQGGERRGGPAGLLAWFLAGSALVRERVQCRNAAIEGSESEGKGERGCGCRHHIDRFLIYIRM